MSQVTVPEMLPGKVQQAESVHREPLLGSVREWTATVVKQVVVMLKVSLVKSDKLFSSEMDF